MAQGISLHIGLNSVDPMHYQGWSGDLAACEYDAKDMAALAKSRGFSGNSLLLSKQAKADAVIAAIKDAAKQLKKGDIFFLSYAGHGGQVPDTNKDEADRTDETWVLYDRQLVDDELYALYAKFKAGVRVIVLSDSCHSGTVTRALPPWEIGGGGPVPRVMPPAIGKKTYAKNKPLYHHIQASTTAAERSAPKASILLISGCQDNQVSLDGNRNGLFTETMKKVWNKGAFKFGYRRFRDTIVARMPPTQTPNYYLIGAANPDFENQQPFTV
ncbi:MAG: caspase family protein [Planctomycetota bacterium]